MMAKVEEQPREQRRGWLKNGNPPGDFSKAPRCGAKNRRGTPCQAPAMKNGRCRLHGGKSTGPRTPEGLERMRKAKTKHGLYAAEAKELRRLVNLMLRKAKGHLKHLAEVIG
jgi:hypothetical protein